jgi:CubicO group peptidase (beta-lactamase class C family)
MISTAPSLAGGLEQSSLVDLGGWSSVGSFDVSRAWRLLFVAIALALATAPSALAAKKHPTPPGPHFDGRPAEYASALSAKEVCSRVFVAGGDPEAIVDDARVALTVLAPGFVADAARLSIDREAKTATVEMPPNPARTAAYAKSQGCVILPAYSGRLHFEPRQVRWRGPARGERWPLGERIWHGRSEIDRQRLRAAIADYMESDGTRAVVVVHKGELVGEAYAKGFGRFTPQRAWSASKSLTATLTGLLVDRGWLRLNRRAPIREWRGDERREITLRQLLNMTSGLQQNQFEGTARSAETFTPENGHSFIYFDGFDTYADALENPLEVPPDTRWQYRNVNVLAVATAIVRELRSRGLDPMTFPQRRLLERLGMRMTTLETDPYGQYIASGTTYTTARDLARLGLLHLNGGRYAGERFVSREWVRFVRAPAPTTTGYGGFWWLNRERQHFEDVPASAYFASGAFGQISLVIPSHDLVIARLGFTFPDDPAIQEFAPRVIEAVEAGERGEGRR